MEYKETFCKKTAIHYGRNVHGLTAKRAGEIYDSLPTAWEKRESFSYCGDAYQQAGSSSGLSSHTRTTRFVLRADFDAAVASGRSIAQVSATCGNPAQP